MNLRDRICYLLARMRIHNPDCEHCNAHLACGSKLRNRLEELKGQKLTTVQVADPDSKVARAKRDREQKIPA